VILSIVQAYALCDKIEGTISYASVPIAVWLFAVKIHNKDLAYSTHNTIILISKNARKHNS